MNPIDNLIFTSQARSIFNVGATTHTIMPPVNLYWPIHLNLDGSTKPTLPGSSGYDDITRYSFVCGDDTDFIEKSMQKHWFDIGHHLIYTVDATNLPVVLQTAGSTVFSNFKIPPYHLIYAYLMENSRIAQIFEKLIQDYVHDEKYSKANGEEEFRWLVNTENLFFKQQPHGSYRNTAGTLRPLTEGTRRNAYQRLFGLELGFGDFRNSNAEYPYTRAQVSNQSFIILFESLLGEFWQAYINARNAVGPNTTDVVHITETSQRLQEMLLARRTYRTDFNNYRFYNLSREEFSAVIMMSWLHYAIASDGPVVTWLGCGANTAGERLINIGNKVGLPAHSKSVAIIDIAAPSAAMLRSVEIGDFNNEAWVNNIIHANDPNWSSTTKATDKQIQSELLTIINNWETITGHPIKNQNKIPARVAEVKARPEPAMN